MVSHYFFFQYYPGKRSFANTDTLRHDGDMELTSDTVHALVDQVRAREQLRNAIHKYHDSMK